MDEEQGVVLKGLLERYPQYNTLPATEKTLITVLRHHARWLSEQSTRKTAEVDECRKARNLLQTQVQELATEVGFKRARLEALEQEVDQCKRERKEAVDAKIFAEAAERDARNDVKRLKEEVDRMTDLLKCFPNKESEHDAVRKAMQKELDGAHDAIKTIIKERDEAKRALDKVASAMAERHHQRVETAIANLNAAAQHLFGLLESKGAFGPEERDVIDAMRITLSLL